MIAADTALLLFTFLGLFTAGIAMGIGIGRLWATADFRDRLAEALGEE